MTITAHCLVKNEARFVWYSVMSVIDHVDQILLYDTGSTDGTLEVIRKIQERDREKKVVFKEYGEVTSQTFPQVRQAMLDDTKTDWFIVVDGDEIWWEDSVAQLVSVIKKRGEQSESIVVPTYNLVGDVYHYQEEEAGQYRFGKLKGHYNLRAVNRTIPGLYSFGEHGTWGWVDDKNQMIQDRSLAKALFVDAPYLHATFLPRASEPGEERVVPKRARKLKYELGIPFTADFYYPEVFFRPRPKIVPSVWQNVSNRYKFRAFFETPLKKIKRRILPGKVGY